MKKWTKWLVAFPCQVPAQICGVRSHHTAVSSLKQQSSLVSGSLSRGVPIQYEYINFNSWENAFQKSRCCAGLRGQPRSSFPPTKLDLGAVSRVEPGYSGSKQAQKKQVSDCVYTCECLTSIAKSKAICFCRTYFCFICVFSHTGLLDYPTTDSPFLLKPKTVKFSKTPHCSGASRNERTIMHP